MNLLSQTFQNEVTVPNSHLEGVHSNVEARISRRDEYDRSPPSPPSKSSKASPPLRTLHLITQLTGLRSPDTPRLSSLQQLLLVFVLVLVHADVRSTSRLVRPALRGVVKVPEGREEKLGLDGSGGRRSFGVRGDGTWFQRLDESAADGRGRIKVKPPPRFEPTRRLSSTFILY